MELQHVNAKFLISDPEAVDLEALIPVFHRWIQEQVCEELLLDIADYRHVPYGPGIVLIGHQADYSLDNAQGHLGVRYNRKAALEGSNSDRLRQAALSALKACQRLEAEQVLEGRIRFNGHDMEFFVNDRLLVPNREEVRRRLDPEFKAFFDALARGSDYELSYDTDARRLLRVSVKTLRQFTVAELVNNLES